MENNLDFDATKTDLVIMLNFIGAMNLGFALQLIDNDGQTLLWNPSITGQNPKNTPNGIIIKLPLPAGTTLAYFEGKGLALEYVFRGLDVAKLPNYQINVSFLQNGVEVINGKFSITGKLTGVKQRNSMFISLT